MKRMKTLLALILTLLMAAVSACALAELGSGTCGENLTWVLDDAGTLTISGSGDMTDYRLPSEPAPWNELRTSVLSVVLKEGVTSIGNSAFWNCTNLASVTIPSGVTRIGRSAFSLCSALTSVTIPAGVTDIGDSAFSGCSSLSGVTIPAGVQTIGNSAFANCTSLTGVTLPDSVTSIGNYAFSYTGLTSVVIPAGMMVINDQTFTGCAGLTSVTIPDNVKTIGFYVFRDCTKAEITLPDGITSVSAGTFQDVKRIICRPQTTTSAALNGVRYVAPGAPDFRLYDKAGDTVLEAYTGTGGEVVIPQGVTSISDSAFKDCTGLTAVTIPDSVTSIGSYAFFGCTGLTAVTIPAGVTSIEDYTFRSCTGLTAVTIPAGVTSIGSDAFSGCSSLTAVTIPDSVTGIGSSAFCGCTQAEITLPDGVASVGSYAFDSVKRIICNPHTTTSAALGRNYVYYAPGVPDCRLANDDYLQTCLLAYTGEGGEVAIPQGVTSISNYAFQNCTNLTAVTIPAGVTSIGSYAFYGCTGLTSVTIPAGVTSIGGSAFSGCTGLTSVTIPAGVTSIGGSAFSGCSSLTSVTIPAGVTSIGIRAFYGCTQAEITLPDGVASVGSSAFDSVKRIICNPHTTTSAALYNASIDYRYCAPGAPDCLLCDKEGQTILAKYAGEGGAVVIPQGVTSIANSAFQDCTSLTAVTIPDSVTSIGGSAFYGCSNLTGVTIPAGVTSIGSFAFSGCTELTSVTIPAGVTSIEDYTFRSCTGLTAVTIPAGMKSIGGAAFRDCSSLTEVTIPTGVTSIASYTFSGCTQAEITLPDGITSVGSYAFDQVKRIFCHPQSTTTATLRSMDTSFRYHAPGAPDFELTDWDNGWTVLVAYTGGGVEAVIPQGVMRISMSVFQGCSNLTSVTIPEGVKSIGDSAFAGCTSLTSITLPDSVYDINNYAFSGCTQAEITLPDDITDLGLYVFDDVKRVICNPLTRTSSWLRTRNVCFSPPDAVDFGLYEEGGAVCVRYYTGDTSSVLMPKHAMRWSTTTAFASLRLPETLDADCSFSLTAKDVIVPDGVTNLGTLSLTNVQRLYLPDSVQNLDGLTLSGTKPVVYCSAGSTAQAWAMFSGYETRTDGWGDECTLSYPGALTLDVRESVALRRTDFVISPIPADYRGEITLESAGLAVDGMTVTALEPGDATVTATLDDRYSVRIPVHVYQPAERIVLKVPSIVQAGQSFTVTVEELAPEDISGKLSWTVNGVLVYRGTDRTRSLTAPSGQKKAVVRVTAPGGAYSEVTVRVPTTISDPTLRSNVVELGSLVGICVDVDGETLADDPLTYGTVELGASTSALTLEDGVVRATGLGTVTFRVKGLSGSWAYLTVTVQDTLHAYRTQVPAKAPNCVGPGNTAYGICRGCGRFFNAEGEEITEGSWVLPATHVHHLAGGSACRDCGQTFSMTGLNVMTLPSALRVIRNEAFAGATAQTIVVPVGCESVGERAFAGCAALRSIFLPAALEESLPESAFEGCDPELEIIFR